MFKALSHGAIFLATCNAILLLEDEKLENSCFHHSLLVCFLTYQTFVTNLHLVRVELRCMLKEKLHRVTGPDQGGIEPFQRLGSIPANHIFCMSCVVINSFSPECITLRYVKILLHGQYFSRNGDAIFVKSLHYGRKSKIPHVSFMYHDLLRQRNVMRNRCSKFNKQFSFRQRLQAIKRREHARPRVIFLKFLHQPMKFRNYVVALHIRFLP